MYAPERYKEIVEERYTISKHSHITYSDTANITPIERRYLLQFVVNDLKKESDIIDAVRNKEG